jgi:hypothetical protein
VAPDGGEALAVEPALEVHDSARSPSAPDANSGFNGAPTNVLRSTAVRLEGS